MVDTPRHTILAVDDERSNLLVLNRTLAPDYILLAAKTGGEALRRALGELPDLILLDLMLPDTDGFDVLRELKACQKTKHIPVIIVSGMDSGEDEKKARFLGAADYITKPYTGDKIRESIESNLNQIIQS